MEHKLYEGVYFTDFRNSARTDGQPQCAPNITPHGIVSSPDPVDTKFITFEQLKQTTDTSKLAYLFSSIMKRQAWLVDSTKFMLEDRDLWHDADVACAIDENAPLVQRYTDMLAWIVADNCHAVEKGDLDRCAVARENAESLLKMYEEFKLERGIDL